MANARNDERATWTPPYIPWARLLNLIEKLESNRPPRIDRTILTGSNQVRSQTLNALTSLELIDENGSLTDTLNRLVDKGEDRVVMVRGILERFYPEAVELGNVNGTEQQLEEAFRQYGVSGSTARKAIAFFLKAAEYAELRTSAHFKAPTTPRRRSPRKRTVAAKTNSADSTQLPTSESADTMSSLRVRYVETLMKMIDSQEDLNDNLLNRIERLLKFPPDEDTE